MERGDYGESIGDGAAPIWSPELRWRAVSAAAGERARRDGDWGHDSKRGGYGEGAELTVSAEKWSERPEERQRSWNRARRGSAGEADDGEIPAL